MKKTILRDALRIARDKLAGHPQYKFFCHYAFIVQDNKIVEWATNTELEPPKHLGYHTRLSQADTAHPKAHAEFNAYKKAKGILDHSKPFECINIRLNKVGEMKMSAPCCCCQTFLDELGCSTVYFSTDNGKWAKEM